MIDEDWRAFNSAFAENVRRDDPRGRTGRRMLMVGLSTVLAAALGAVVYGALGGPAIALPSEVVPIPANSHPTTYQAGGQTAGQTWTAIAGPSCAASTDGSTGFAAYGYYTGAGRDQTTGWSTSAGGGFTGEGCSGGYLSVPVSGKAAAFDDTRFVLWRFDFSAKFTDASCRVASYVPTNSSKVYVGGAPAYFYYYGADYTIGTNPVALGGFQVDQITKQGQWVSAGPFNVTSGQVAVKLVDAGARSPGSDTQDVHAAAAQVRLTCTST
jgi:translation initiation factor IF-2